MNLRKKINKLKNVVLYVVLYGTLIFAFQNCSNDFETSHTGKSSVKSLNPEDEATQIDLGDSNNESNNNGSNGSVSFPTIPTTTLPPGAPVDGENTNTSVASKVYAKTTITDANYSSYTVDLDLTIDDKDIGKKGYIYLMFHFPENPNGKYYANSIGQIVEAYNDVPAFKTYNSLQKNYSYKSILDKINLFGENKDQKGVQGAVMSIGYGFGDDTDKGLAEMLGSNRFIIADRIMGVSSSHSGPITNFKLTAEILPGYQHSDKKVSVYVAGYVPTSETTGDWYFLVDPNLPWVNVGTDASKAQAAYEGVLRSNYSINIVPQATDISSLKGTRVYMGYGVGANPIEDLLLNGRFLKIYEVK